MRKNIGLAMLMACGMSALAVAQPLARRPHYDLTKDRVLYTVGYAHLDTEWNWDYPTTINDHIKRTMTENFRLFELYPDYVFNFTGSRRYAMMKEYYPDLYQKVKEYVAKGRWYVSGSSVDEGEVNITSSESLIRQVLYGNKYFRDEFGKESMDYILPDCFGFLCNIPSVFHYCGLLGFSTQKLTWHSAVGIPFNVGVWNGPDDKGIIAALNATSYTAHVEKRLDKDPKWTARLDEAKEHTGYAFDYRYYGVGDEGGAPRENDVKRAEGSLNNADSDFKVLLTSSDQMYQDITPDVRQALPVYKGDLLLIEHSAGSMTSQGFMKRMNRKNELLATAAEAASVTANWVGQSPYPSTKLSNAWDLVLGSQFHDILPGTSIPKAYEYAWNDEFIAANGFATSLTNGVSGLARQMDTQVQGRAVVVYNPVAHQRDDIVTAELTYDVVPDEVAVFDGKGRETVSQIVKKEGHLLTVIFRASVPSLGGAVYDVRAVTPKGQRSTLAVTDRSLENEYYKVQLLDNGDIKSIWDKKARRELLASPARLEFQREQPEQWPAWNMDWKDRQQAPFDFMNHQPTIAIEERGPVRVTLRVHREGQNSKIDQLISLAVGDAGKRLEIANTVDWQSREVSLKAAFPLTVTNEMATYNLGVGTIARATNDAKKFEVPSKEWFDLTDEKGHYGVSVLEDCKYGSDKPDDHTLRLTLLYTPKANSFVYQSTQDWGIHEMKYALYGHQGSWAKAQSPWQAKFLNQPLLAFETTPHAGDLGHAFSMLKVNNPQVGMMALKKMEANDYYMVRVNELSGQDLKQVHLQFPTKIEDAYEVDGQERRIGEAQVKGRQIRFGLSHYTIRSFAVKLAHEVTTAVSQTASKQAVVELPYDTDVMSHDTNRDDGRFSRRDNLPAELVPDTLVSEGIAFVLGPHADGLDNAVSCKGQVIDLPQGNYDALYLLAAATEDSQGQFDVDGQVTLLPIQKWTGFVGQFYNRILSRDNQSVLEMQEPFAKRSNIAWYASHVHQAYPSHNQAYQYGYLYKYKVTIPVGAKTLTLPQNEGIKVMAATLAHQAKGAVKALQPLYDDFDGNKPFVLREKVCEQ